MSSAEKSRQRVIVHLDADAFFVSVEQALHPELKRKKVAVGGLHRGIISSASYEARACGVYTPMPTSRARQVCPDLLLVSHTPKVYGEFSRRLFKLCEEVTPWIEKVSVDEGYLDFTPCGHGSFARSVVAAKALQERIVKELDITVSFGIATNMLVSAIASKLKKPRGFTVVEPGTEKDFLAPLSVGKLPGVGTKTEAHLKSLGFETFSDVLAASEGELRRAFGDGWRDFVVTARGEDDREVETEHGESKSHSQQETFGRDVASIPFAVTCLKAMVDDLLPRIRADEKRARTLTIRVRYPDFTYSSASHSLDEASDLENAFYPWLEPLLRKAWARGKRLRLVSVKFSELEEPSTQLDLFANKDDKRERLAKVMDKLRNRPGGPAVVRGWSLEKE